MEYRLKAIKRWKIKRNRLKINWTIRQLITPRSMMALKRERDKNGKFVESPIEFLPYDIISILTDDSLITIDEDNYEWETL